MGKAHQRDSDNANSTLGLIWRSIKVSSTHVREAAYKTLVRPKLEYTFTAWSPWQTYLISDIEKVCRSAGYDCNDYNYTSNERTGKLGSC